MEINWSFVSTIASSITAIIAIVAPVITSVLATKSQERMKKAELFSPRVYDALAELVKAYAELRQFAPPADDSSAYLALIKEATDKCIEFRTACYKVMSLTPSPKIQEHITDLLADIGNTTFSPDSRHDKIFCLLMNDVNAYLLSSKGRKIQRQ